VPSGGTGRLARAGPTVGLVPFAETGQPVLGGVVVRPEAEVGPVQVVLPAAAVQQVVAGPEPELVDLEYSQPGGLGGAAEQPAGAGQRGHQEPTGQGVPPVEAVPDGQPQNHVQGVPPVVEHRFQPMAAPVEEAGPGPQLVALALCVSLKTVSW